MMDKQPKDFQKATAEHIIDIFKTKKQRRVLLSDEVGLGKTIVAKEVIRLVGEMPEDYGVWDDQIYRVIYICSNINIVKQNTENLGINEVMNIDESRLSMQHLIVREKTDKLIADASVNNERAELLIPLTPGTSFNLQFSAGNVNERALIYVLIKDLQEFEGKQPQLKRLLNVYNANEDNWNARIHDYEARVDACGEDYKSGIRNLLENEHQSSIQALANVLNHVGGTNKSEAIAKIRIAFSEISMQQLDPDLVILDEFQRFSSLLDTNENNEESLLARKFFGDEKHPMILLLSATPYKPFTTLEELNENNIDEQYRDFIRLMDFLFTNRDDISFQQIWHDYSKELCHLSTEKIDILVAKKTKAEDTMYQTMSRTERYQTTSKEDIIPLHITADDIISYCQMQNVIDICREEGKGSFRQTCVPMDYVKSSPYLLSFMDKYELKKNIVRVMKDKNLLVGKQKQRYLLKINDLYNYKDIPTANARLKKLEDILFKKGGEQLLWIPASHPYYKVPAGNVFAKNSDFSKVLVFSAWEMVPRMIAAMVSYKAEQKSIKEAFPNVHNSSIVDLQSTNSNTADSEKKAKTGIGRLTKERLELLSYPSEFLADAYRPNTYFGEETKELSNIKEVRNDVRNHILSHPNIKVGHYPERGARELLTLLQKLDENPNIEALIDEDDIVVLIDIAIASPGVCMYRVLKDKDLAEHCAQILARLFNRRQNAAIIDNIYGHQRAYYELVLDYCVMGNLQAVLDEFAHMIDERPEDARDCQKIHDRMLGSFVDMGSIDVDTTASFARTDGKKWHMRTHYAMPYAKIKTTEKDVNRANGIREAFNSPFRPFVLASTSVGQEGLDFHWYCRKIMHWNTPSNPQDMEQREGRINRYKSLSIRRNVAKLYPFTYDWNDIFKNASHWAKEHQLPELVPFWSLPQDMLNAIPDTSEKLERIVPMYPMSNDIDRYEHLKAVLALYRLTMGQPRQEELLVMLKGLTTEQRQQLLFNLSPIARKQ